MVRASGQEHGTNIVSTEPPKLSRGNGGAAPVDGNNPVAEEIRQSDELLRDFGGKALKAACYAPFVSLYLTTTGGVQACCRNESFILGDLKENRLHEIWNGRRIRVLRKALHNYNFSLGCQFCEWESKRRGDSFAIRLMSDPFPVLSSEPDWPAMIEFNGSNTCNLECIMCTGDYSSAIRGNRQGLPPLQKVYGDQFFSDLRPFLPHLHFINFLGGEPFLAQEVYRVYDLMIEDGLVIPCRITTNGTQYSAKIQRILTAIPTHITVSIDGVTKQTYESIRRRSNFETVIENVHRFRAYTQECGMNFGLSFCLMRQNWHEMGEMFLLAEQLDCELSILMPTTPSYCTLFTLPPDEFRQVLMRLEKVGQSVRPQLTRHRRAWEETIEHLREASREDQVQRMETLMESFAPENPIATAERLADQGEHGRAQTKLMSIPAGDAFRYHAVSMAADVAAREGKLAQARQYAEDALRITAKLPDAYYSSARIEARRGAFRAAVQRALQARERMTPEERIETRTLALLGALYVLLGEVADARSVFGRLAALPRPSKDGILLPDTVDRALRFLRELLPDESALGSLGLAERTVSIYRAAAADVELARRVHANTASPEFALGEPADPERGREVVAKLLRTDIVLGPHWSLRIAGVNNRARLLFPNGDQTSGDDEDVRVSIQSASTLVSYDIQLNYARIALRSGGRYRVSFRVRADEPREVPFGIAKASAPWSNLGFYQTLNASTEWQSFEHVFFSQEDEPAARLHFDLGTSGFGVEIGSVQFAEIPTEDRA